jgi:hypothetical protein
MVAFLNWKGATFFCLVKSMPNGSETALLFFRGQLRYDALVLGFAEDKIDGLLGCEKSGIYMHDLVTETTGKVAETN